jgi:hypothetical protein
MLDSQDDKDATPEVVSGRAESLEVSVLALAGLHLFGGRFKNAIC